MSRGSFTGEFLVPDDPWFTVDLAQHWVPYLFIADRVVDRLVVEVGCGAGYGAHHLALGAREVHAYDRNASALAWARSHYRADNLHYRLEEQDADPEPGSYGCACSFQVVEHVARPEPFLDRLADLLEEEGTLYLTTPNRLTSAGENIYHVHEYEPKELARLLEGRFSEVRVLGITGNARYRAYRDGRRQAMDRFLRLDPFGLRRLVPRFVLERLFPILARAVRRRVLGSPTDPGIEPGDFLVGCEDIEESDDLLAICTGPR
jgi:SAM-dependent methyltransferase